MTVTRALITLHGGSQESVAPMSTPLKATADACHEILDAHPALIESHRNTIMSSFNRSLIERLPRLAPGKTVLTGDQLRSFLSIASPDDFSLLVSRGLGVKGLIAIFFGTLAEFRHREPSRAQGLADVLANEVSPFEKAKTSDGKIAWIDDSVRSIRSPLLAGYLTSQVKAFPDTFHHAVDVAVIHDNLECLLRYHLAGLDFSFLPLDHCTHHTQALVSLMGSEHGKLLIHSHTGKLEEFIESGLSVSASKWIKSLGDPA
jgi:hypothetical protein